eukprot:scaffold820_cov227-Pinguiococcus_pyrenoidosus.AAC.3
MKESWNGGSVITCVIWRHRICLRALGFSRIRSHPMVTPASSVHKRRRTPASAPQNPSPTVSIALTRIPVDKCSRSRGVSEWDPASVLKQIALFGDGARTFLRPDDVRRICGRLQWPSGGTFPATPSPGQAGGHERPARRSSDSRCEEKESGGVRKDRDKKMSSRRKRHLRGRSCKPLPDPLAFFSSSSCPSAAFLRAALLLGIAALRAGGSEVPSLDKVQAALSRVKFHPVVKLPPPGQYRIRDFSAGPDGNDFVGAADLQDRGLKAFLQGGVHPACDPDLPPRAECAALLARRVEVEEEEGL